MALTWTTANATTGSAPLESTPLRADRPGGHRVEERYKVTSWTFVVGREVGKGSSKGRRSRGESRDQGVLVPVVTKPGVVISLSPSSLTRTTLFLPDIHCMAPHHQRDGPYSPSYRPCHMSTGRCCRALSRQSRSSPVTDLAVDGFGTSSPRRPGGKRRPRGASLGVGPDRCLGCTRAIYAT